VGRGAEGKRAAPQARARGEGSGEEAPCSRRCHLDNIAEAKESKIAKAKKSRKAATLVGSDPKLDRKGMVKMAKLDGKDGFALFEEAAFAPFTLDKSTSGKYATQPECEAARDSVNAKRAKRAAAAATTA
jgi:hypothetical protein